jgi:diguanylate cyclase (GGDEF)-like protein
MSSVFLFLILAGRHNYFRRQAIILFFSVIVVWTLEFFYLIKAAPSLLNLTPIVLCFCWIIYWIFGYRYLKIGEVVPINYGSIIENINDGVIVLTNNGIVTFLNKAVQDIFSIDSGFIGKHISCFWPDYNLALNEDKLVIRKDIMIGFAPGEKYFDVTVSPVKRNKAEIAGKLLIMKDITDRKKYEDKINYMSFHDYLTGLYNRAFFEEELKRLDVQRNLPLSIVSGDVNGLKMVNDTYGHERGDELLVKIAGILKHCFRKSDIVSRWGGDEFIILLPMTDYCIAEEIVSRIEKTCSEHSTEDMPLSISLGISTKIKGNDSIEKMLKAAEAKMYINKMTDGKRTHRLYRKAFTREEAIKEIRKYAGIKYDPEFVKVFLEIMGSD